MRRAVAVATAAVALVAGLAVATAAPADAVSVGQALAAPHIYAGGGVLGFGAPQVAPPLTLPLSSVVVTMAPNPVAPADNEGYWLASADGGVYAQGNAGFYGSLGALRLQGPVVAMAATPDGKGYWLAALDGGVFAFGDAPFLGSMGGTALVSAVTGMAPSHSGLGYWMVAGDGGIFTFGDAPFHGSIGGTILNDPVVGMAAMSDDGGYYMVATDGGIFTFGNAPYYGSLGGGLNGNPNVILPISGIALAQGRTGYWLLDPDGFNYSFANPPDPTPSPLTSAIVATATSQVNADPYTGYFCNPYGPCEAWCSLFATWVWEQAGVPIPSYAFTGDMYDWAQAHTTVLPPYAMPSPGDAVLYGTGPWSTSSSVHVGLVMQVWPDGAVVTVEGDAGPAPVGNLAVIVNGPYLPSHSQISNGMPIYAFARP